MYQSQEVQKFLRITRPFDNELSSMHTPSLGDICKTYEKLFAEFNTETSAELILAIDNAFNFGIKHIEVLQKLKKTIKGIVESFGTFSMNYWTMLDNMQDFESTCVSEYFGREYSPILNHLKREAFINPFEVLLGGVRQEIMDMRALLEAISSRSTLKGILDKLHAKLETNRRNIIKLQSGKKTLKAYFTTKPSSQIAQELETSVKQTEEEIYKLEAILRIITVRMAKAEIPLFNESRLHKYQRMMRFFAKSGIQEFDEISKIARGIYFRDSSL
mmetsp:Transcript_3613/g.7764  ORF Transcript_3613/g.7764 Transcript_3613/m.7764 type:complete len:274 (-) Transcript_3613:36-857(-)